MKYQVQIWGTAGVSVNVEADSPETAALKAGELVSSKAELKFGDDFLDFQIEDTAQVDTLDADDNIISISEEVPCR